MKTTSARVPLRISFGGGGSDVEPFVSNFGGSVVASTINLFIKVTVKSTDSNVIRIRSSDTLDELVLANMPNNDLLSKNLLTACLIQIPMFCRQNLEIEIHSPVPRRSGLGGSSAICIALLAALYTHFDIEFNDNKLALDAFHIERNIVGVAGGCQDQWVCSVGGLNHMEFLNSDLSTIESLTLDRDFLHFLSKSLMLVWTGDSRPDTNVIVDQVNRSIAGSNVEALHKQKAISFRIKHALKNQDFELLSKEILESWDIKKRFSPLISNDRIDKLHRLGMTNGASAGKILGAGAGGFFLFLVEPEKFSQLRNRIELDGYSVHDVSLNESGWIAESSDD